METKIVIMLVLAVVTAVILVPTVWDAVWTEAGGHCFATNTSACPSGGKDCKEVACIAKNPYCVSCINGTTWTILQLVPLIFVAMVIIVGILLAVGIPIPGT